MRFQSKRFTCGPASICNALEVYGLNHAEDDVAKLAGTTPEDGTTEAGLKKALRKLNISHTVGKHRDGLPAFLELEANLLAGNPSILSVDQWSHWIAVVGRINGKYVVVDSASQSLIQFPNQSRLAERWKGGSGRYYAIHLLQENQINVPIIQG